MLPQLRRAGLPSEVTTERYVDLTGVVDLVLDGADGPMVLYCYVGQVWDQCYARRACPRGYYEELYVASSGDRLVCEATIGRFDVEILWWQQARICCALR
jgi:hypothetical protein